MSLTSEQFAEVSSRAVKLTKRRRLDTNSFQLMQRYPPASLLQNELIGFHYVNVGP